MCGSSDERQGDKRLKSTLDFDESCDPSPTIFRSLLALALAKLDTLLWPYILHVNCSSFARVSVSTLLFDQGQTGPWDNSSFPHMA